MALTTRSSSPTSDQGFPEPARRCECAAWSSARGDFLYSTRTNEDTDEVEVVRYRLVEPF